MLVIGYACGLVQSGYYYGKLRGIDIRTKGSGNVGATNTLRVFGNRAGALVLACDFLKAFIPCMIVSRLYAHDPSLRYLYVLYMGIGVVLGHSFPAQLGFKGGKGVASSAGVLFVLDWRLGIFIIAAFLVNLLITHLVSLGSILAMVIFIVASFILSRTGVWPIAREYLLEFNILCTFIAGLSIIRHKRNIDRLAAGTESRIDFENSEVKDD